MIGKHSFGLEFSKGREYHWFILMFVCTLPFKNSWGNLVILLLLVYVIYSVLKKKSRYAFSIDLLRPLKTLPILFSVLTLSLFYSSNIWRGLNLITRLAPLIVIPFLFSYIRISEKEKKIILFGFVGANILAILFNVSRALVRSLHFVNGKILFDASVLGEQTFWYSIVQGGNFFFIDQVSWFLHPTYWSIYLLLSIAIILRYYQKIKFRYWTKVYALSLLILLIGVYLCSSRVIMVCTGISLALFLFINLKRKVVAYRIYLGILSLVLVSLLVVFSPRFGGLSNLTNPLNFDLRLKSWHASIEVFKQHPILGTGIGDSEDELMTMYGKLGYQENLVASLNEHNQYLHFANASGLVGLITFFIVISYGFYNSYKHKDYLMFIFIFSFSVTCLVENLLDREAGITYFALFYCLLFMPTRESEV